MYIWWCMRMRYLNIYMDGWDLNKEKFIFLFQKSKLLLSQPYNLSGYYLLLSGITIIFYNFLYIYINTPKFIIFISILITYPSIRYLIHWWLMLRLWEEMGNWRLRKDISSVRFITWVSSHNQFNILYYKSLLSSSTTTNNLNELKIPYHLLLYWSGWWCV